MNQKDSLKKLCGNPLHNGPFSVGGAQRAVGRHADALRVAEVDQLLLGQVRVTFNLRGSTKRGNFTLLLYY